MTKYRKSLCNQPGCTGMRSCKECRRIKKARKQGERSQEEIIAAADMLRQSGSDPEPQPKEPPDAPSQ